MYEVNDGGFYERRAYGIPWSYPDKLSGSLLENYPFLRNFYMEWEMPEHNTTYALLSATRTYWWAMYVAIAIYGAFIYFVPKYMAKREPFDLRGPLKYWNLFLAAFSIFGTFRVLPNLIYFLSVYGFKASICAPPVFFVGGKGPAALWSLLFTYSKYVELIDTVFIVLRKRKLSLLHWYHHMTVLAFCWFATGHEYPLGTYFAIMNYIVHSVMYLYYFLASHMKKPPRWGKAVTVLQIAQMFGGIIFTCFALWYGLQFQFNTRFEDSVIGFPEESGCYIQKSTMLVGCAMYASYLYLFVVFFIERYLVRQRVAAKTD